jgi:FkbM family methyltransferase
MENFELLQLNSKPYKNIQPLRCGIWKTNTNLKIENVHAGNNAFTVTETNEVSADTINAVTILHVMEQFNMPHMDILKLDIEGSEKELFEENFEQWLPKTKVLIIELHDEMKKGCSRAVFNSVNQYDFSFNIRGENIIFTNNAFK